ncbi:carbonic anhydrase [Melampsora americana]|nr:carbonic anhydrase [Melampsora americana]
MEQVISIQETSSLQSQIDSQLRISRRHRFTRRQTVSYSDSEAVLVNNTSLEDVSDLKLQQSTTSNYESKIALDLDDQSKDLLTEKDHTRKVKNTSDHKFSSSELRSETTDEKFFEKEKTSNLEKRSSKGNKTLGDENESKNPYRSDLISEIFHHNEEFIAGSDPSFRQKLTKGQHPKLFWIGCSDSRVPESVVIKANMGEVFVHRNIANTFQPDDTSLIAALDYAIEHLNISHIAIVGHELCGGCQAALTSVKRKSPLGNSSDPGTKALSRWLRPLEKIISDQLKKDSKTELSWLVSENVKRQVSNVSNHSILRNAWFKGKSVTVHGWIYDIGSGKLNDLGISRSTP